MQKLFWVTKSDLFEESGNLRLFQTNKTRYREVSLENILKSARSPSNWCCHHLLELLRINTESDNADSDKLPTEDNTCNPWEYIRNSGYICRSATKLSLIHKCFQLIKIPNTGPFRFLDLCGAPGSFCEYIVNTVKKQNSLAYVDGWGISISTENQLLNWDLARLSVAYDAISVNQSLESIDHCNSLTITYGDDGTGNICSLANQSHIARLLNGNKMHLITADGATDPTSTDNTLLLAAELSIAIMCLSRSGDALFKAFDPFLSLTITRLVYILHSAFEVVYVVKPVTSRPWSGEVYIVCCGYLIDDNDDDDRRRFVSLVNDVVALMSHVDVANDGECDEQFQSYVSTLGKAFLVSRLQAMGRTQERMNGFELYLDVCEEFTSIGERSMRKWMNKINSD